MANGFSEGNNRRNRVLVIACYKWDWQEVLTLESAISFKSQDFDVQYLDLSAYDASFFKTTLKGFIGRGSTLKRKKWLLNSLQIEVVEPKKLILWCNLMFLFFSKLRVLPKNELMKRWEIVYPGLVDITGDLNVNINSHRKLVRRTLTSEFFFSKLIRSCTASQSSFDSVIIVNGRFPLNRAATVIFREKHQNVKLIEFGANREKFEIYSISPHSTMNRLELFRKFMEQIEAPPEEIKEVGSEFFRSRRVFDNQANLNWTRRMEAMELPDMGLLKVCTFFPTSVREFIGVSDIPKNGEFANQFDALESLIVHLGIGWKIFVRRHPMAIDSRADSEVGLWERFRKFDNVEIIEPNSTVDSYELGMRSDLVAHYNSFIGPELIFAGHKSVITLGNTQWRDLDPRRHINREDELIEYLRTPDVFPGVVDICLLGFYMSTFGQDFTVCNWSQDDSVWTLS